MWSVRGSPELPLLASWLAPCPPIQPVSLHYLRRGTLGCKQVSFISPRTSFLQVKGSLDLSPLPGFVQCLNLLDDRSVMLSSHTLPLLCLSPRARGAREEGFSSTTDIDQFLVTCLQVVVWNSADLSLPKGTVPFCLVSSWYSPRVRPS